MPHIELDDEQWQALEDDFDQHVSEEIVRLGFVEIDLMKELKQGWRARGEVDDRGQPI
jgi:hypothetical protein